MRVIHQLAAAAAAAYIILAGGFCLLADIVGAQEILPVNAPEIQTKAIHIMTAEERSEIIIQDIWRPPELDRVKIGAGAALSKRLASDTPADPYGWQAFVSQDAIGSGNGGRQAEAYGRC